MEWGREGVEPIPRPGEKGEQIKAGKVQVLVVQTMKDSTEAR